MYRIVDVGTLGGTQGYASGVNDRGDVVGIAYTATGQRHAFMWNQNAGMRDLTSAFGLTGVRDINSRGDILGEIDPDPVLVNSNGSITVLHPLPGHARAYAASINDTGDVAGRSIFGGGHKEMATKWVDGVPLKLGTLPGGDQSFASHINNFGKVVGFSNTNSSEIWRAALFSPAESLGGFRTADFSDCCGATAINDLGWITGTSAIASIASGTRIQYETRMFLWKPGTGMINSGVNIVPAAINNAGEVVGVDVSSGRAVLYRDGILIDLTDVVGVDSGWTLHAVTDIDNLGYIVGAGLINGEQHAYMLVPTPEPASTFLVGFGLAVGAIWLQRSKAELITETSWLIDSKLRAPGARKRWSAMQYKRVEQRGATLGEVLVSADARS